MIVLLTYMDEKGKKISELLIQKLNMSHYACEGLAEAQVYQLIESNLMRSMVVTTDCMCRPFRQKQIISILLHNENSDSQSCTDGSPAWSAHASYDLSIDIGRMGTTACVEAVSQVIAIRMMQYTRTKKEL